MAKVIFWFIFLFSIQSVFIVVLEIAGGAYSLYDPPSFKLLSGFGILMMILLVYSSYKIINLYKGDRNE
jgi:hypothetical protein